MRTADRPGPPPSPPSPARVYRWDEIALERTTEMMSRKVVAADRVMLVQAYLKRGALVPSHQHESEQLIYVLEGALRVIVEGRETVVRSGEVLWVPAHAEHQAEALDDTLELDIFSPPRTDWGSESTHADDEAQPAGG